MHAEPYLTQARQQAELASAEAKALNPAYMQGEGMDDMGDFMEAQLAAGRGHGIALAKQGKCEICKGALHHGPWTDEQIAEAVADTGEPNFGDWCDSCFLREVGRGDLRYASELAGRPLQLTLGAGLRSLIAGGLA